ncbi:MAG: MFS transporter [Chloroflexi bacterium]|nr:MFS transporter [Chloroflexota bacterium]
MRSASMGRTARGQSKGAAVALPGSDSKEQNTKHWGLLSRLPRLQTFDSLIEHRNYRLLWIGNFFANSAQWFQLLTIGWLVRELTAGSSSSSLLVVTVGGLNTLPGLIIGPWGGVLGDRIDRRKLIISIQTFMAVFAFLFAFFVLTGRVQVWHAYAYVLISGTCLSVTQPMRQVLIANTVPREALANAYAANVLTITGTRLLGPLFGGILIATLGFFWNFAIEAVFYISMVLVLLPMKTPYYQKRDTSARQSPFADLKEGLRYVWKDNRVILFLIILSLIPNVILQPLMFLLPVFTEEVLNRGPDVGGYLLAVNGFGGLVAAFLIASVGFVFKKGLVTLATVIVSSIFILMFAQAQWLALAFPLIAMFAFSQSTFRTATGTIIQTLVPDELRARITSLQRYGQGFVVISSLLIGWPAGATSVPFAITTMGAVGLSFGLIFMVIARRIRQLD